MFRSILHSFKNINFKSHTKRCTLHLKNMSINGAICGSLLGFSYGINESIYKKYDFEDATAMIEELTFGGAIVGAGIGATYPIIILISCYKLKNAFN